MDILMDAVLDSIKLVPFLYVVYILIAYLENHQDNKLYNKMVKAKWGGPIMGALIGCVPQCGFSVIGSNLYSKKVISLGTLIAIFVSTSDEAIPILLAYPAMIHKVFLILGLKVLFAIVIGLIIEAVLSFGKKEKERAAIADEEVEAALCEEGASCGCGHNHNHRHGHGHSHHHEKSNIWVVALKHSLKTLAFIFVVNLVLGGLIEGFGEEHIRTLLLSDSMFQPALAALIGLIPNCAASIVLTEMFVSGTLSLGSLIAGLCTGAGVGLVVLFRANKNIMDNLKIVGILYVTGTVCGLIIQLIG